METEMELDDVPTRQSSKFSLGSSLSVLSADEQLDGDGPLTPTDKIQDGEDDGMSELNSLIDSTGTLSNAEVTDDDDMLLGDHSERDSASPLSSIPDDFPLSRSATPEINEQETSEEKESLQQQGYAVVKENASKKEKLQGEEQEEEEEEEEEEEDDEEEEAASMGTRGRRKEAITRQQKLKQQQKQKSSNKVVKSAANQAKDKENEKETGSRRKRTKKDSPSDKAEETKSKRQRTSDPKSRKGLNKQQRKEEEVEDGDDEDECEDNGFNEQGKKEDTKVEHGESKAKSEDKPEKETPAESSNHNNDKDENKENIEQNDPEIKADSQDIGDQDGDGDDDETRHKEALEALTHIEIEFARLRDKMYQEKMTELNEEAIRVANGTHPDLVASIAEIEEKKTKRISSAEAWREHQYANFKKQFEGFEYQANVHFITQKNALRRKVLSGLNDKKWCIEDEHTKQNDLINNTEQYPDRQQMVAHKQKQKDEMTELRDIRQTVGFPIAPVPTGLCTEDINEDFRKFGIERPL